LTGDGCRFCDLRRGLLRKIGITLVVNGPWNKLSRGVKAMANSGVVENRACPSCAPSSNVSTTQLRQPARFTGSTPAFLDAQARIEH
jgi:hypothetical protein